MAGIVSMLNVDVNLLTPARGKFPYMTATTGTRIRTARERLRLRQQDLAVAAGVSRASVSQWESGDTKTLKPKHLFAVARRLGIDAEWLATGKMPNSPSPPHLVVEQITAKYVAAQPTDRLRIEIGRLWAELPPSRRDALYTTMLIEHEFWRRNPWWKHRPVDEMTVDEWQQINATEGARMRQS